MCHDENIAACSGAAASSTSPPALVQGALESGLRAAREAMQPLGG